MAGESSGVGMDDTEDTPGLLSSCFRNVSLCSVCLEGQGFIMTVPVTFPDSWLTPILFSGESSGLAAVNVGE